jgi:hypothetical protein
MKFNNNMGRSLNKELGICFVFALQAFVQIYCLEMANMAR